jgi:hypothetical protein
VTADRVVEDEFEVHSEESMDPRQPPPRSLVRPFPSYHDEYHQPPRPGYRWVWRQECENFFRFYNVPKYLWITLATMHMKGSVGRWVKVQRLQGGLNNWDHFIQAVQGGIHPTFL